MSSDGKLPIVVAITGASGAIYAVRLLQMLLSAGREVHLTISPSGASVIKQELDVQVTADLASVRKLIGASNYFRSERDQQRIIQSLSALDSGQVHYHQYQDYFTPIASGSYLTEAMVICPCSGGTLSGIVRSNSGNLIERAAEVHLKERRQLIIVPRETPLSTFQIENMHRASQAGIVVLPAAPGWYHGVQSLGDLVDFVVARVLDQLRVPNDLMKRWK